MALRSLEPYTRSILRLAAGFTFSLHGWQKLVGFLGPPVPFASLLFVAGCLEAVGGLLLILGLFTRPVAVVLCGEMVAAYVRAHFPRGPWPLTNGGELAVLYAFVFLYLATAGPGPISLDALRRKER